MMRALAGVIVLLVLLWLQNRGPVFAFVGGFASLLVIFYLLIHGSLLRAKMKHDRAMRRALTMLRREAERKALLQHGDDIPL